ncbi:PAS domain-containing protein [Synechococcus sp. RSCCF101]|uniref:sensor histidine kinase n=1 Tax=Synechococcus sp. RSCCF101 TaxID=2511069 RepID=UPI00124886C3|nr:PAS domain-containing sensor histidine kinase [Synechococcus sp. RSCCF101]QEY31134.1 PAS domain-containing protein [Synechococcus sp. RSCCF101]
MNGVTPLLLGLVLGAGLTALLPALRRRLKRRGHPELQRDQLLAWIDTSPQGWLILDPQQCIRYINPRAEKLLRLSGSLRVRGRPLAEVLPESLLLELVGTALRRQQPQRSEWALAEDPLEGMAVPGGQGWCVVLVQSRLSIEAQMQQQDRWVSDVAHELKTPLTALVLVGDQLEMAVRPQDARLVGRLQRELNRLRLLVEDLLELSRLENSLPLDSERYASVSLGALVEEAWSSVGPLAEARAVSLCLKDPDGVSLSGDRPRLHRALLNLLDNAIRYSPEGGSIDVTAASSGQWRRIAVRDRGPGLSDHDIAHMFERFYRGDPSRTRSGTSRARGGSGLGLAIVKQIAVTHGGRVQARNHPEGGAVLELLLPRGL